MVTIIWEQSSFLFQPQPGQLEFNGSDYNSKDDDERLTGQIRRVFNVMKDLQWRSLSEIRLTILNRTGINDSEASISAQLRHLRKDRFGSHEVEKRARGDRKSGLFEYQLVVNLLNVSLYGKQKPPYIYA